MTELIKNGKCNTEIKVDNFFVLRLGEKGYPFDGKDCNLELKYTITCEKLKKSMSFATLKHIKR